MTLRAIPVLALLLSACGLRGPRVPEVTGTLADVLIEASFVGEPAPEMNGPLLMDSIAFMQLAELTGASMQPQRSAAMVDPAGVLLCPARQPCRMRDNAVYLTVWDAQLHEDGHLDVTLSRTYNIRRLYVMTETVTHQLRLRREGGTWRLTERGRLPG